MIIAIRRWSGESRIAIEELQQNLHGMSDFGAIEFRVRIDQLIEPSGAILPMRTKSLLAGFGEVEPDDPGITRILPPLHQAFLERLLRQNGRRWCRDLQHPREVLDGEWRGMSQGEEHSHLPMTLPMLFREIPILLTRRDHRTRPAYASDQFEKTIGQGQFRCV